MTRETPAAHRLRNVEPSMAWISRKRWPFALLPGCLLLLSSCRESGEVPGLRVETVDGETHVYNPSAPAWGLEARPFTLAEVLGAESEIGGPTFGRPLAVEVDDAGNRYVLDGHAQAVQVLGPDGEWVGTLGQGGEGPGEFRAPSDLALLPDHGLAVLDPGAFRVTFFRTDGEVLGQLPIPEYLSQFEVRSDGSILAYPRGRAFTLRTLGSEVEREGGPVLVLDPEGNEVGSLSHRRDVQAPIDDPLLNKLFLARLPGDSLILSFQSLDRVEIWGPHGTLARVVHRPVPFQTEPSRVGEEDRGPGRPPFTGMEFDILSSGLAVHPDGRFWAVLVPRSRARFRTPMFGEPEIPTEWAIDLFDRQGRWLARQPLDFPASRAALDWGTDGLYLLNVFEDAAVYRFQFTEMEREGGEG